MKRWLIPFLVMVSSLVCVAAWAQTNVWIAVNSGQWEVPGNWSLTLAPTNSQSIIITNFNTKSVTIDPTTAGNASNSMTVQDLLLAAPSGSVNTLALSGSGAIPLTVLTSLTVSNDGAVALSNATLQVSAITNKVFLLDSSDPSSPAILTVTGNSNTVSGTLCVGLNTNANGNVTLTGQMWLTNGPAILGVYGAAQMTVSNGANFSSDQPVVVGSGAGSQGTLTVDGASFVAADHVVIAQDAGSSGSARISNADFAIAAGNLMLVGGAGAGECVFSGSFNTTVDAVEVAASRGSRGTLTVAGGAIDFANVQGPFFVGNGLGSTGTVWLTGGNLVATNAPIHIAPWGYGAVTVSNGGWLGSAMYLALHAVQPSSNVSPPIVYATGEVSRAVINIEGGTLTLLSKLVVGNCVSGGVGIVTVRGGSLLVTNATHTAFIDVRNGQLNVMGGIVQTDKLVMTNSCGLFISGGGTLIYSTLVLDSNMDADGDGLSNSYELGNGLNPLDAADANADTDGDGLSNLQEFIAGTSPTNATSVLRIISVVATNNDEIVTWMTAGGRTNIVQATSDPAVGFANISGNIVVAGTDDVLTNYFDAGGATNSPLRVYRIRLVP